MQSNEGVTTSKAEESYRNAEACVKLLKEAKTDNEKLAALLIVPRLLATGNDENTNDESQPVDTNVKEQLLHAIGFQFLRRLISTGETPGSEGDSLITLSEDQLALKTASYSVLGCFTEGTLLSEEQLAEAIQATETTLLNLNECISLESLAIAEGSTDAKDSSQGGYQQQLQQLQTQCLEYLEALSQSQSNEVIERVIFPAFYRIAMKQSKPSR